MEKIFMVIIICVGQACEGIWQNTTYPTMDDCLAAAPPVREYFMSTYPDSSGNIYCMNQPEFEMWKKQIEAGNLIPPTNIPPA